MNLYNLLVNILVAIILVVLAFWLIGLIAASLPVVAVTLLKVFVVIVAVGWILGFMGNRITLQ